MSFTIDVHHHILPEVFWRATNDAHNPVGGKTPVARRKAEFVLSAGGAGTADFVCALGFRHDARTIVSWFSPKRILEVILDRHGPKFSHQLGAVV
jgi:hypothetical protein